MTVRQVGTTYVCISCSRSMMFIDCQIGIRRRMKCSNIHCANGKIEVWEPELEAPEVIVEVTE